MAHRSRRSRLDRRTVLFVYTALEVAIGSLALAWAILAVPVDPAISLTGAARPVALLGGLAFWSGFTLLGGTRVGSIHGYGVLTFHMPFILAAAALGGPAAGGVVAFVGTMELRELRDPPWYGLLANHAALALAGVVAGVVMALATATLAPLGLGSEPTALLAFVFGAAGFVLVSVTLAAGTSMIRDATEAIDAYTAAFRATMVTEIVVGLMLALLYGKIGVWAAVVGGVVVLQLIRLLGEREFRKRDVDTPALITFEELQRRTDAAARVWPIGYLVIVIEEWKAYVDECGRDAADRLAKAIGEAIASVLFERDSATRSGGGEWRVLLVNTRIDGAIQAALKYRDVVQRILADAPCNDDRRPDGTSLTVTIGGGIADDTDHGGSLAVSRAEQAWFRATRDGKAVALQTDSGWFFSSP